MKPAVVREAIDPGVPLTVTIDNGRREPTSRAYYEELF